MKYKYEDIESLDQMKDILLQEICDNAKDSQFVKIATSYLDEILEELLDYSSENVPRCNELIRDTLGFLNSQETKMLCPMCEGSYMEHKEINGTHIYICEQCPFVGFELIERQDIKNMSEFLEGRLK